MENNRQKRKCEWTTKYKKILGLTVTHFFTSLWYELKKYSNICALVKF